jgi:HAD superfamily hydrolase (TIGR01490 family)
METTRHGGAFFDVDKTLLPGVSAEQLLVVGLLKGCYDGGFRLFPFLIEAFRLLPRGTTVARKANKAYLSGARAEIVRSWADLLFEREVRPRLGSRGAALVAAEKERGRGIVLLSGMPDLLLEPFLRHFGADFGIGTPLEVRPNGRLTGRRSGPHPYGRAKLDLARALAHEQGWDPAACSAYGDHRTDAILLDWVGEAVAVDPDPGLRAHAARKGWRIVE